MLRSDRSVEHLVGAVRSDGSPRYESKQPAQHHGPVEIVGTLRQALPDGAAVAEFCAQSLKLRR